MALRNFLLRPRAIAAAATLTAIGLTGCGGGGSSTISGAGATFPAAAYQRWSSDYAAATGNQVNYQSVGSGAGVRQFAAGTVDFGASDEQLSDEDFKAGLAGQRGAVQIPMLGGTVTPAYNNADCPDLKLTQAQLADIFLGKIKDWKDLGCPSKPITVAHRSDGSGTTYAFTNSLACFSPEWNKSVGKGKSVNWPVGIGAKGNEGVAGLLSNTPGSIGYVNLAYVKDPLRPVALQNKDGKFVTATVASGAAALNSVVLNDKLGGEDCNPAGAESFPIVAFTWILAYETGYGDKKAEAVRNFLDWSLGEAPQKQAAELGYVPLTGEVLTRARAEVAKIRS
ncbi:phosphate ABC transporter substrate-binding protein PstS [Synechococcus sp. CS-1328]|uniref:phosphate ABC transporter substrate-binding protein PstS n=1 Tax=Synechococcus sp. CS-1328 TaxID=2847976 RepID=UPI0021E45D03|nr:phosphate ABC transporter substrate-binding protein PstS [Synechococcus sp. CS-1328]MCT0226104.1 phosphate ABC transporter substrate-binding protein PstS [Synechococcus sp. CS-1328]